MGTAATAFQAPQTSSLAESLNPKRSFEVLEIPSLFSLSLLCCVQCQLHIGSLHLCLATITLALVFNPLTGTHRNLQHPTYSSVHISPFQLSPSLARPTRLVLIQRPCRRPPTVSPTRRGLRSPPFRSGQGSVPGADFLSQIGVHRANCASAGAIRFQHWEIVFAHLSRVPSVDDPSRVCGHFGAVRHFR